MLSLTLPPHTVFVGETSSWKLTTLTSDPVAEYIASVSLVTKSSYNFVDFDTDSMSCTINRFSLDDSHIGSYTLEFEVEDVTGKYKLIFTQQLVVEDAQPVLDSLGNTQDLEASEGSSEITEESIYFTEMSLEERAEYLLEKLPTVQEFTKLVGTEAIDSLMVDFVSTFDETIATTFTQNISEKAIT